MTVSHTAPAQGDDLLRYTIERSLAPSVPRARRVLISRDLIDRLGYSSACAKCEAIRVGDKRQPTLAHSAECRARDEGLLAADPFLKKKLERATQRQEEFSAKRVELGDPQAKRGRADVREDAQPEPSPAAGSEARSADFDGGGDAAMGSGAAAEGGRSRACSTVTYGSDQTGEDDAEMPMPAETEPASGSSSAKRPREGSEGDDDRVREVVGDPDPPEDAEVGASDIPEVLMLG